MGAVQIGVEMRNAASNLLARLQDMEFTVFTEVFQRARAADSAASALGGNGQFVRLARASNELGNGAFGAAASPKISISGYACCSQAGETAIARSSASTSRRVTEIRPLAPAARPLVSRDNLQCWRLIPEILGSSLRGADRRSDIVLVPDAARGGAADSDRPRCRSRSRSFFELVVAPGQTLAALTANHGLLLTLAYVLCFGPCVSVRVRSTGCADG